MSITYCVRCVTPSTRPDLTLDDSGVCSACRNYEARKDTDWDQRKKELIDILGRYRSPNGSHWDCVIPVSGGKDSVYQVLKMLEFGMNPLCVTATTCDLSELGRRNLENLKNLGVDLIEFSANPVIRRKLNRIGLINVGDISWPEHVAIFTIPVRVAAQYGIPLIIWGENSQNEYGGPSTASQNNVLTRKWLHEYGGLLGMEVEDLIGVDGIEERHLIPYTYPSDEQLGEAGVNGIFLGHYLPWDGFLNALRSQAYGFETFPKTVEGSMVNYENLDNYQTGIHDYFKFLKFGFSRATDIASLHIRRQSITREEGLSMVRKHDGKYPMTYLDKSLDEILYPVGIGSVQFHKICDHYTNRELFMTDSAGRLIKDSNFNLTKVNYDNV